MSEIKLGEITKISDTNAEQADLNRILKQVNALLTTWEQTHITASVSIPMIRMFNENSTFVFVDAIDLERRHTPQVALPKNLQAIASQNDLKLVLGAYYISYAADGKKVFKIQLQRSIWKKLSDLSKITLVIHELLRHIQLNQSSTFDEVQLQRATSIITLCKPVPTLGFSFSYLVFTRDENRSLIDWNLFSKECVLRDEIATNSANQ